MTVMQLTNFCVPPFTEYYSRNSHNPRCAVQFSAIQTLINIENYLISVHGNTKHIISAHT